MSSPSHVSPSQDSLEQPETVLVTGFPAYTARRMIAKTLSASPSDRVLVLARPQYERAARDEIEALDPDATERAEVLVGDVCDMDLGLSGAEFRTLAEGVTTIHHLAGAYFMGVDRATAERVNVGGTRGVIEVAAESRRLRRLCHWSTAFVSGKRKGVILEDELDEGQAFHNFWEETKLEAERLARAAQRTLPVTILRPTIIVGDSVTGEIDKFDGPYSLIFAAVTSERGFRLPIPARGPAPLHLVPIDFAIDAGYALGRDQRSAGGCFHLSDPNPLPAARAFALLSELAHHRAPPMMSPSLARTLLRAPGLGRLTSGPRAVLDAFDHQCLYNSRDASRILADHGIRCPPLDDYAEALVSYAQKIHQTRRRELEDVVFDPFD